MDGAKLYEFLEYYGFVRTVLAFPACLFFYWLGRWEGRRDAWIANSCKVAKETGEVAKAVVEYIKAKESR